MSPWNRKCGLAALALVVIFFALLLFSASQVRGTDQYWYVADVASLLEGSTSTNHSFARIALDASDPVARPAFVHHNLSLYLVLLAAVLFGPFLGWVITNGVAAVVTSCLTACISYKIRQDGALSLLVFALSLFIPVSFWQSSQPLTEATFLPFVACAAFVYVFFDHRPRKYVLLWFLLALAFLCRSSFLPLLSLMPVLFLWHADPAARKEPQNLGFAVLLAGLALMMPTVARSLFDQSMSHDLRNILMNGLPGGSNMDFMLNPRPASFDLGSVIAKSLRSLKIQFLQENALLVFYAPFNLMLVALPFCWRKSTDAYRKLVLFTVALVSIHFLVIVLHQNQFRYLLVPQPFLIATTLLLLAGSRISPRILLRTGVVVVAGFVAFAAMSARNTRAQGRLEYGDNRLIAAQVSTLSAEDERFILCSNTDSNQLVYAMRPRHVTAFSAGISEQDLARLIEHVQPHWLLCGNAKLKQLSLTFSQSQVIPLVAVKTIKDMAFVRLSPR